MSTYVPVAIQARGIRRREGLLKAAKALFLLNGLASITVDDICLAAGTSKGGFYHHFADKESVFLEVALEELEREMARSAPSARDEVETHDVSPLLLDLWAWAPRRPQTRRRIRTLHRRALRRLSRLPGPTAREKPSDGDRQAQAALALFVGIGRVVGRARARRPAISRRGRGRAAAG